MKKITLKYFRRVAGADTTYNYLNLILWPFWFFCSRALVHFCDGYGWVKSFGGRVHFGLDVDGDGLDVKDDPIDKTSLYSPCDGIATLTGWVGDYGNMIEIACNGLNNGYKIYFRFGHLRSSYVNKGQKINKGQNIGIIGTTGHSTSPHVHAEVWVKKFPFGAKHTIDAETFWKTIFREGDK